MTTRHHIQFKKRLLDKRTELIRVGDNKNGSNRLEAIRHADFVDRSAHSNEESVQVRLRQTDSRLLKAIDSALFRIERGTFGVCEVCAEPIPAVRLNAVPWARLCRECKEQQDAGQPRHASVPQRWQGNQDSSG